MALEKKQLIELARANAKASLNPSATFSFEGEKLSADALNKTFVNEHYFTAKLTFLFDIHDVCAHKKPTN